MQRKNFFKILTLTIHFNIIEIRENPFLQSVNIELYSWNDFGRSNLKNKHKSWYINTLIEA